MPKFPKAFTRRKSTANAFEEVENDSPVEHTFKVFDRGSGDSGNKSFDGGVKLAKPSTNGHGMPKPAQGGEDNMFENLGKYRYVHLKIGHWRLQREHPGFLWYILTH